MDTDKYDGTDASGQGDELDYNLNKEAPHDDRKTETDNKDKSGAGRLAAELAPLVINYVKEALGRKK